MAEVVLIDDLVAQLVDMLLPLSDLAPWGEPLGSNSGRSFKMKSGSLEELSRLDVLEPWIVYFFATVFFK